MISFHRFSTIKDIIKETEYNIFGTVLLTLACVIEIFRVFTLRFISGANGIVSVTLKRRKQKSSCPNVIQTVGHPIMSRML